MTTEHRAPIGPTGLAIAAAAQGAEAFTDGAPLLACPYGPDRPYARRAWVTGYNRAAIAAGVIVLDTGEESAETP